KKGWSYVYGRLRGVKLGSNMVVRGVYTSDTFYSPETLPRDMALPIRRGQTWEDAYRWLWLPQTPDENAAPEADMLASVIAPQQALTPMTPGFTGQGGGVHSGRGWTPSTTPAPPHENRRMERRHFQQSSSLLGRLLRADEPDKVEEEKKEGAEADLLEQAAKVLTRHGKATGVPSPGVATQEGGKRDVGYNANKGKSPSSGGFLAAKRATPRPRRTKNEGGGTGRPGWGTSFTPTPSGRKAEAVTLVEGKWTTTAKGSRK
ncbi:unnamed protein product, partial [Choristocarpus tenellus]